MIETAQCDKESILSPELFDEIYFIEDPIVKTKTLLDYRDKAKELGVLSNFDFMTKSYEKMMREIKANQEKADRQRRKAEYRNDQRVTEFYIAPNNERIKNLNCGSWVANQNGIIAFNLIGYEMRASYQPILPVEVLENIETGEEQIVLAFYHNNRWKEIKVGKDIISSSSKIVALSKYGVSVTSENAKYLVKYLNDVENLNREEIDTLQSTSKLGWHGKDFIPYDTSIIFDGDIKFKQIFESIQTQGSELAWVEYVRKLRSTKKMEIRFMLAAAFASVMIKPLGILPFFVDLWGQTEGGKSVCLMLACSVWANPDGNQYIGDYKSTDVALEVMADMLNNLPVLLDDTSNATRKIVEDFENIVYRLCSGKGKSRSNKELGKNRENNWKTCFITNGERSLSEYVNQGGAINRIIEIEAGETIFENPQETASFLKMNYGFAGKLFVNAVKEIGFDSIKERYADLCRKLFSTDKMQKQAMSLACLILADQIATAHIFKDGMEITIDEASEILIDKDELSDTERFYQYLLDQVAMNNIRFDADTNCEKWGFIKDGYAHFYRAAFDRMCSDFNASKKRFLKWAAKKKIILLDDKGKLKVQKVNGKTYRTIAVLIDDSIKENDAGFVEISDEALSELPFE